MKHTEGNQTLVTFLTTENLSGLPCLHECKYGAVVFMDETRDLDPDLPVYR